jgi:hypothetical protein
MAHYQVVSVGDDSEYRTYNTDFAVGPSGFNVTDDVMLIQKMLRYLYIEQPAYFVERIQAPVPAGIADMAVDGQWSDALSESIKAFKLKARQLGDLLYPDAIVLPCGPDARVKSRVTAARYTITVLIAYSVRASNDPSANPYVAAPSDWPDDTDNPKELRDALKVHRERAWGWSGNS